jgi:hypothetical protein
MERQAQGAPAYGRVFPVLQIVHELLLLGKSASQRDVYYRHDPLQCLPHESEPPLHFSDLLTEEMDSPAIASLKADILRGTCAG